MVKSPANFRHIPLPRESARWNISQSGRGHYALAESRTFSSRVRNVYLILLLLILAGGLENSPATASVAESSLTPPASESQMKIKSPARAAHWPAHWLGVEVERIPPVFSSMVGLLQNQGLLVIDVVPSSPAGQAGLQPGDLLYELNGHPLILPSQLIQAANAHHGMKAAPCKLTFIRRGKRATVVISPQPRPALSVIQSASKLTGAVATPKPAFRSAGPANLSRMVPGPGILVHLQNNAVPGEALPRFFSVTRWTQKNGQLQTMQIATQGKIYDVDMAHLEKLPPQIATLARIFDRLHQNALPAPAVAIPRLQLFNRAVRMRQPVKKMTVMERERLNLVRQIALLNADIKNLTAVRHELAAMKGPLRSTEPPGATAPESGPEREFECKMIDAQLAGLTAQRACLTKYLTTFNGK